MFNFMKIYKDVIVAFLLSEIVVICAPVISYYIVTDFLMCRGAFVMCRGAFVILSIIRDVVCLGWAIKIYMKKRSEKDNVYRVDLFSITPEITVWTDCSKASNILDADMKKVDTILIQKTGSDNYYKEIITGKLIPVSRKVYVTEGGQITEKGYCNFTAPLCIYMVTYYNHDTGNRKNSHEHVTLEEVEQYVQERKNGYEGHPTFKKYIEFLQERAEGYYETAKQKNETSDEKKLQKILKTLKQQSKKTK